MTVRPFFSWKMLCGSETSLTSVESGAGLGVVAANAGAVSAVAAASKAKRLSGRMTLKSPENIFLAESELSGSVALRNAGRPTGPSFRPTVEPAAARLREPLRFVARRQTRLPTRPERQSGRRHNARHRVVSREA